MYVISAATGEFGRLVVDQLLERVPAADVAVAVRQPAKADDLAQRGIEVRYGDYDQPASLRAAYQGATRLLFISSPDIGPSRLVQHRNVVEAARDAGVGSVIYTSGLGADVVDEGVLGEHHATEAVLADSGLPYTILRHPIYSDFFINPTLQAAMEVGEITSSTGGRGLNTATRADLAEAAAVVLTSTGQEDKAYDFTGRLWTYPELAAVLTDLRGSPVSYREVDHDEGIIAMLGIGPLIRSGGFERQTGDLEQVLGRPPMSLSDAVSVTLTQGGSSR
jgi:NAD(P)H dehydrogenase (quinone)